MDWKKDLGSQIRDARESCNLTQMQLASRVGVERPMISRYENGRDVPGIDMLAKLAEELDTTFRVMGREIKIESLSPRLRTVPRQLRLDFEKARQYTNATIRITPTEGQIFITAKIPA